MVTAHQDTIVGLELPRRINNTINMNEQPPSSCLVIASSTPSTSQSSKSCDEGCSIDGLEFLDFKLPPRGASAGKTLHHAKHVLSGLFAKHDPMIFTIGYTHNPVWRWSNTKYGYMFERERWTHMTVLYESAEPYSPAMLEAALIDTFRSTLKLVQL